MYITESFKSIICEQMCECGDQKTVQMQQQLLAATVWYTYTDCKILLNPGYKSGICLTGKQLKVDGKVVRNASTWMQASMHACTHRQTDN